MASGSVLTHAYPSIASAGVVSTKQSPVLNRHTESTAYNGVHTTRGIKLSSNDTASLSELESPSSTLSSRDPSNNVQFESSDDIDAEGSVIAESDEDAPRATNGEHTLEYGYESDTSTRPGKRKLDSVDDDYIRKDPELYGLRRSGRSRASHRIVESSAEDDDSDSDINTRPALKRRKVNSRKASENPTPVRASPSNSDVESGSYGNVRVKSQSKRHRRRLVQASAGTSSPTHTEVRFSTRRAAKVANYNEDEDEDEFELSGEDGATPTEWPAEHDGPAIDRIVNHRRSENSTSLDPDENDYEYHVKWQGKSYYHATWESYSTLNPLRGSKKVRNYFKNVVERELDMNDDPNFSLDDKEKYLLDREAQADAFIENTQIERVIDDRGTEAGSEYLVKWKGLFYDSCTWEPANLVSSLAQSEIDRYLDRISKLPILNKAESNPQTRRPYKAFREQPVYVKGGELREFQIRGVNFLAHNWCRGNSVILADEMGLGKTVQTVSFISWLHHERQQEGPFVVVVPLSTLPAWADTFNHWAPDINYVVYTGNEAARSLIREKELFVDGNPRKTKFNVLLTTYDYITMKGSWTLDLSQIKWQFLAVDEAHRLKNRGSGLYAKLMELGAPSRLLITGTPVQNNLTELSALMHFLMPGKIAVDDDIDLQSEAASRKLTELTETISPYIIRRTKRLVEKDLPPKTEKIIRVELSDVQLEYYKNILTRNYAALNAGGRGHRTSLLNIMMELKKASNHPFMFPNAEERILAGSDRRDDILKALITSSGKMMLLDQLLTKLKRDGHRVLIFSQMVRMLDIMGDYLQSRGHQFQRLDGMIGAPARKRAIDHFNAAESKDFCFILSTRAGGLGINLMTADTVILFDSDWNPQADLQAMARAHRIGQKFPVTVYRLVSKDTVEEEVLERARNKLMLEFITIQRGVTDKDANAITNKLKRSVQAPEDADDINRILKRRGQKMFEQSGNQRRLEELDIDAVLENAEEHKTEQPEGLAADGGEEFLKNFEYTDVKVELEWDDIIPKDQLEEIKAVEVRKEEERYLASVIEQNAPRRRKAPGTEEREQRAAKKRARDLAAVEAAELDDSSESEADPARPLQEKEIRNLIRAYERFGSLDERGEELIKDAKLVGRDIHVLEEILNEILGISRDALKEEQERLASLQRSESKSLTKKDKKAVLFDYHGVKRLNAETLLERPLEMRMLRDLMAHTPDFRNFRVPEATKPASYTCSWGAREDGMLCVGIFRHGYGAWAMIRDDPDLGMGDKFYLEEHQIAQKEERSRADAQDSKTVRSPGAVHLVRRANYLMSVLKDKTSNGTNVHAKRALENHHRNNKKHQSSNRLSDLSARPSSSPAPGLHRKHRESASNPLANQERTSSHVRSSVDRIVTKRQPPEHTEAMERRKYPKISSELKEVDRSRFELHLHHEGARVERSTSNGVVRSPLKAEHREISNSFEAQNQGEASQMPSKSPQRSERMEKFFAPQANQIERLKGAKKAKDNLEKLGIMKEVLRCIARHITNSISLEPGIVEDDCWEYFAQHFWLNSKSEGAQIKKQAMRALEQDCTPLSKDVTTTARPSHFLPPELPKVSQSNGLH